MKFHEHWLRFVNLVYFRTEMIVNTLSDTPDSISCGHQKCIDFKVLVNLFRYLYEMFMNYKVDMRFSRIMCLAVEEFSLKDDVVIKIKKRYLRWAQ